MSAYIVLSHRSMTSYIRRCSVGIGRLSSTASRWVVWLSSVWFRNPSNMSGVLDLDTIYTVALRSHKAMSCKDTLDGGRFFCHFLKSVVKIFIWQLWIWLDLTWRVKGLPFFTMAPYEHCLEQKICHIRNQSDFSQRRLQVIWDFSTYFSGLL